jgi:hypothetical protein
MLKAKTKNSIMITLTMILATVIPACIFSKWAEAVTFFFCHWFIREQFPKQYHHILAAICRNITACVLFFGVSFTLPFELSLLSAIPICYFISWVGFIKKNSDDFEIKCEELEVKIEQLIIELKQYKQIDLYKMSEEELRRFAQSRGLSEVICDTLVLRIVHHYRWVDIEKELNFSKEGIRYHKEQIIDKLGFKP